MSRATIKSELTIGELIIGYRNIETIAEMS